MTELIARVATTGTFEQGNYKVRITREAIESIPEQITGDKALSLVIEHDPFCMPIGKTTEAWVEPFGKEYAAMARIHVEDRYTKLTHGASGVEFVRLEFEDDPRPFVPRRFDRAEGHQNTLSVDLANFASAQDYAGFAKDVDLIDDSIACDNSIQRHSLIPEPLLQLVISNPEMSAALAVGVWTVNRVEKFVRYTIDETLRKVADDISDSFSNKIKKVLSAYMNHRSIDERGTVVQVVIPGDPELILLTRTEPDEEFLTTDLKALVAEMEEYGDILQSADSVTFARVKGNDWKLQYLTTKSGKAIGTLECYEQSLKTLYGATQGQSSESEDKPE